MAAPSGSRLNVGTCPDNVNIIDIVNVSSDVNPITNVEENNIDHQKDGNLSCPFPSRGKGRGRYHRGRRRRPFSGSNTINVNPMG